VLTDIIADLDKEAAALIRQEIEVDALILTTLD
jgi:hypothetical protein